jgi:DNA-binding transcriptional LysR family regulator
MATFVRIAETGSISRAARSLGLSVAMASRHLRWLEEELGATLIRRTTRKLLLTDAGRELLGRARTILAGVDEARDAVRPGGGAAGRVVLAAQPAFGMVCLTPVVATLLGQHPRLHVDLRLLDRAVDFVADGIDVAVLAGQRPQGSASLVARQVGSYEILLCASPGFLAAHEPIRAVADLARVPCVIVDTGPSVWSLETKLGPESVAPRGRVHTNDLLTTHRLVLAGVGASWLPAWLAGDDLRSERLVRILPDATPPKVDVFAVFDKRARGAGAVRLVIEELTTALGREARTRRGSRE